MISALEKQNLRAFVTLLPAMACATAPSLGPSWAEIAHAAGDKDEAKRTLNTLSQNDGLGAYLDGQRMGYTIPIKDPAVRLAKDLASADGAAAQRIGQGNPRLRRPATYRLLQLNETARAATLAEHPAMRALVAQASGQPPKVQGHLSDAAALPLPPLWAVRALRVQERLAQPEASPAAREAWVALSQLKAPGEAIKRLEKVAPGDCLAAVAGGLAHEELGRSAAAGAAFASADCVPAQIHQARVLAGFKPAAARAQLTALMRSAPLDATLLHALRKTYSDQAPEAREALKRLIAWHPDDHEALRDRLTELERAKDWVAAYRITDRALRFAYTDALHVLALRYLALSGATKRTHEHYSVLHHRLAWLRQRRPDLSTLTQVDALVAGADDAGGGLGAASLELKPAAKAPPKQDAASTAGESQD